MMFIGQMCSISNWFLIRCSQNSQKSAIALEYRMSDGGMKISVRRAMLYYFAKRLRLDAAQALDSPHESPLVVSNRADFDAALAEAMI